MPSDLVCADYAQLERLSHTFKRAAARIEALQRALERPFGRLRDGAWQGVGADAFFTEMDRTLFPAIRRLHLALAQAGTLTRTLSAHLHQAEEEASALFRGAALPAPASLTPHGAGVADATFTPVSFKRVDTPSSTLVANPLGSDPLPPPTDFERLQSEVGGLIAEGGGIEALAAAIPEVVHWEQMDAAALETLRALLLERQDLITLLLATTALPGSPLGLAVNGNDLLNLPVAALRDLVSGNDQQERYINIFQSLVLWAFAADPVAGAEMQERFWQLSPVERFEFLYSLNAAMQATPDYWPRDPINPDTLAPPIAMSLGEPSAAVQALLNDTVTRARELMAAAATDEAVGLPLTAAWLNTHYGDDTVGEHLLNGPEIIAVLIPPTRAAWLNVGFLTGEVDVLETISTRLSTGAQGIQRNLEFFASLDEDALRRLAQADTVLQQQIYDRLDQIHRMTPAEREALGFSDSEIRSGYLLTRTDIPVPGIQSGESPLMFGITRNTSGRATAWEFTGTGKPDPTIAVYATLPDGPVEFDWYRFNADGTLVLLDAKTINPYGRFDLNVPRWSATRYDTNLISTAQRQSEAARLLGPGVTVEWMVPPLPPVGDPQYATRLAMYESLQAYLELDLQITNIQVVWQP
jgi:WXG100 family type VII secretion target